MKMCEALSKKVGEVILIIPLSWKGAFKKTDLFDYYCIKNTFRIKKLVSLPGKGIGLFYLLAAFFTIFQKTKIIYTRQLEAAMLASFLHQGFILELHTDLIDRLDRFFFERIKKSSYFLLLVLISGYLKKRFLKYGFDKDRIRVLPDGVDTDMFKEIKVRENSKKRVGYGGHLFKGRGIELIERLAEDMPDIDFYLWGGTDELIDLWKKKTKDIDNIFFKGHVDSRTLAEELAKCDVLIMPYQREVAVYGNKGNTVMWMSPMKMFEYMATARPVVASDLPVIREILQDNYNAILVDHDDIKGWVTAINILINDPGLASSIGRNARKDAINKYTWNRRVEKILEVL
jgi:glycosyltransferase involved in cell wall biosynthesis